MHDAGNENGALMRKGEETWLTAAGGPVSISNGPSRFCLQTKHNTWETQALTVLRPGS